MSSVAAAVLPVAGATAIGSLPHTDASAAVALVLDLLPALPAAPSLPRLDPAEGMLAQLDAPPGGAGWLGLRTFLEAAAGDPSAGAVKLQLTGPITLALALSADGLAPTSAVRAAADIARDRTAQLVALARAALPGRGLVVFLDEPGLASWSRTDFPIAGDVVADLLAGALATLGNDVVTGVHCCGRTDWQLVADAGPDVLSLPVATVVADDADALGRHLERGGWVAWGAVPTDGAVAPSPDPHWRLLIERWRALAGAGCDPDLLRRQALVTPACGLAGHDTAQAELILALTVELSRRADCEARAAHRTTRA